jgi:hypothetical protein
LKSIFERQAKLGGNLQRCAIEFETLFLKNMTGVFSSWIGRLIGPQAGEDAFVCGVAALRRCWREW